MSQNNGNGNPPKVELELNQEARLKILKSVYQGQNSYGKFFLYSVTDTDSGEIKSFFAPDEIHSIIQEQKLGVGSEFLLKRVQNGKGSSKLELSILGKAPEISNTPTSDNLRETLLNCIHDAEYVAKNSGLQFSLDEIQKLATTLFIARSKA
jgi:hypothetical protein